MSDLEGLICERLAILEPEHLELRDDSARHAGHKGASGGGHFFLAIVSKQFAGLNAVARHRAIYQALGDLMGGRVHALSITASAPNEP
ncbi:MAG: BolA family transcriptional regulator [Hydrogenophilales bacterium]|nr:BolA family transcriptional regulator [Hydrogenophilales bacterium]